MNLSFSFYKSKFVYSLEKRQNNIAHESLSLPELNSVPKHENSLNTG